MKLQRICALVAFGLFTAAPAAAGEIDPGLWEVRHDFQQAGQPGMAEQLKQMQAQMRAQLDSLPPEQRRMVEQQMQGMLGTGGGLMGDGSIRICMTKEDTEFDLAAAGVGDDECKYTDIQRKGNTWTGRMTCSGDDFQGNGTFRTTLHDRRHYTTKVEMDRPGQGRMTADIDARFVQAECTKPAR